MSAEPRGKAMNTTTAIRQSGPCLTPVTEIVTLQWEENVHDAHREAAEQHELAAQAHRTAAEHNEKGDNAEGSWHSERALEYSNHAFKLAQEAHNKSGQIGTL